MNGELTFRVATLYDAPAWQAAALLEAGKVYERLDQWAVAAETYQELRAKFPKDPSAEEAKTYGLVDEVIKSRKEVKLLDGAPSAAGDRSAAVAEAALPRKMEE